MKIKSEFKELQDSNKESLMKLQSMESAIAESEVAKGEFCEKISSLNEDLLKSQLKESELNLHLEKMHEVEADLNDRLLSFEEENKNLRTSVTSLQNEKNSLLSELETVKKSFSDLTEVCASHERQIEELTDSYQKAKSKAEQILKDSELAKEIYLKDKVKMQKQIENLENDCAKQLSQVQESVKQLENQLEDAEEKNASLVSALDETKKLLQQKEQEWEEKEARHIAQVGILTQNIQTLREDLSTEQKRRETIEIKLDEISGTKLELEAKLENALDERQGLLKRCLQSESECERLQTSTAEMRRKYEDCVAALQELGRENQTLQVENMKHITRKWADDAEVTHCTACGKLFTVTIRKHHCRNCGNIFCNECSAKTATVASSKRPVRVCDVCYIEVTK
ncbi:Early endosome antigen 1, partial [Stegodyphus mimosarum]